METEEMQVYKARLKKELDDLLGYRQMILKQVEIDEGLKKGTSKTASEVFELRERLKEAEARLKERMESQSEIDSKIKETSAFKQRMVNEYQNMLGWREGILKQIEIEKKNLDTIKNNKDKILGIITYKTELDRRQFRQFKEQQQKLAEEIKNIEVRKNEIRRKEQAIAEEKRDVHRAIKEISLASGLSDKNKQEAERKNKEYDNKIKSLDREIAEINNEKKKIAKSLSEISGKIERLNKKESIFKVKEAELNLKWEITDRDKEQLNRLKGELEQDKIHFKSQQDTLKRAFENVRTKEKQYKDTELKIKESIRLLGIENKKAFYDLMLWKTRSDREYKDLISKKNEIAYTVRLKEKAIEEIDKRKEDIFKSIEAERVALRNEIEYLAKDRQSFADEFKRIQSDIKKIEINISTRENELKKEAIKQEQERQKYEKLNSDLISEKEELRSTNLLTDNKNRTIDNKIVILNKKIADILAAEQIVIDKIREAEKQKKDLIENKQFILLEKESTDRKNEQLNRLKEELEKEKIKFKSQQDTLKAAWQEAKSKGVI